jgi:prepilin-type N-terminal cleavage/methylation domain-containing protein
VRSRSRDRSRSVGDGGFTLVELVVALAIFGILLTATVPMVLTAAKSSQITAWRASVAPVLRDGIDAALGDVRSAAPQQLCASPYGSKVLANCRRVDPNLGGTAIASASGSSLCVFTERPSPVASSTGVSGPLWKTCLTTAGGILGEDRYAPLGSIISSSPTVIDTVYGPTPAGATRLSDLKAAFSFEYRDGRGQVIPLAQLSGARLADVVTVVLTAVATKTGSGTGQTETVSATTSLRSRSYGGS